MCGSELAQSLLKNEAYHGWLEFFYGLIVQRIEAQNPIHMMIATLNDLLVYSIPGLGGVWANDGLYWLLI